MYRKLYMSLHEAKKMWDSQAEDWVKQEPLGLLSVPVREYAHAFIQNLLDLVPEDNLILDLGTGSNTVGYFGEEHIQRVIGIDLSNRMLELNSLNMKINALLNDTLPLKSNSIALVTSLLTMRYQTRLEHLDLLEEVGRVLTPEGAILLIDVPLNRYAHQYSSFNPHAVATLLKNMGYEAVTSDLTVLERSMPDGNGFGGKYVHRTYIGMVSGVLPKSGVVKGVDAKTKSNYLIESENGVQQIKAENRVTNF